MTGLYLWQGPAGRTVLRVAFAGRVGERDAGSTLDRAILRTLWLDRDELAARARGAPQPAGPALGRRLPRGSRHPLELLKHVPLGALEAAHGGGLIPWRTSIVGLSGGVDSAVAAALLLDAGHRVEALFMSNWAEDDDGYCTSAADFQDARRVCDELGIPLHKASFEPEYRERVFAHFLAELAAGRTPNPDVLCNREVKFGVGLDYAQRLGAERFATGHYARIGTGGRLLRGVDAGKDQSYFLHALDARQLAHCEFPVGTCASPRCGGLPASAGCRSRTSVIRPGSASSASARSATSSGAGCRDAPGPIENDQGAVVGRHRGLERYTHRPAQRPRHRRARGCGRCALVRCRQGHRAQCARRGPGRRSSGAALQRARAPCSRTGSRAAPRDAAVRLHREGALPPA